MANSNSSGLLSGIYSGLTNTYSYLAAQYPNQVTLENINKARSNSNSANIINQGFASYLQTNFKTIDKDKDGIISAEEMNNMTNIISAQGFTKDELSQLYATGASGLSSGTIENILLHFDDMDSNHDGRITSAEISAFNVNSSKQKMEDEFNARKANNMSVFYGDEDTAVDAYSILSYRYSNTVNE